MRLLIRQRGLRQDVLDGWVRVRREFPHVPLSMANDEGALVVPSSAWRAPSFDPFAFDRHVGDATSGLPERLLLDIDSPDDAEQIALEVLTRLQGGLLRRNRHSAGELFDRVLQRHRALHDTGKPLVRADYNHALDVWAWTLRLAPEAGLAVQLAALFHDIERLVSEADRRIEQHAPDYQAFKDAHARSGAAMALRVLLECGVPQTVGDRVAQLVEKHERPGDDPERALLNDADALSFFSLNSPGFLSYYGPAHTRTKVAYSIARLRPPARARLLQVRYRPDVEPFVLEGLREAEREAGGAR